MHKFHLYGNRLHPQTANHSLDWTNEDPVHQTHSQNNTAEN